jgi:glycosyltransferase involved in cell wall biosynthesis
MRTCDPMKSVTISIITCTYNSEKFLQKALDSVENQSYQNIEHIINDSYSTDGTSRIIRDYIERNRHRYPIKFIHSNPSGVANALNVATKAATGDVIHYLHSDDYYYENNSLEKVAKIFNQYPELVWLTGNFLVEFRGKTYMIPQTHLLEIDPEIALSFMNFISHENTFMKREYVHMYGGFNESKNDVVEYRLWLNLIREFKPLVIDDAYTVFIIHKGSTSTGSLPRFSRAIMRAFHTQRKERVLPLVGYYAEKKAYKQLKLFLRRVTQKGFFVML